MFMAASAVRRLPKGGPPPGNGPPAGRSPETGLPWEVVSHGACASADCGPAACVLPGGASSVLRCFDRAGLRADDSRAAYEAWTAEPSRLRRSHPSRTSANLGRPLVCNSCASPHLPAEVSQGIVHPDEGPTVLEASIGESVVLWCLLPGCASSIEEHHSREGTTLCAASAQPLAAAIGITLGPPCNCAAGGTPMLSSVLLSVLPSSQEVSKLDDVRRLISIGLSMLWRRPSSAHSCTMVRTDTDEMDAGSIPPLPAPNSSVFVLFSADEALSADNRLRTLHFSLHRATWPEGGQGRSTGLETERAFCPLLLATLSVSIHTPSVSTWVTHLLSVYG
jgi:hypothetical protein